MYDTYIYAEQRIPETALTRAFARATHVDVEAIEAVASSEEDGAVEAWGDPTKSTVLRYWTIPGEFPFAVEVVFKQPDVSTQDETRNIVRQVAAELKIPLLSTARDGFGTFLAIAPNGNEVLVDEDGSVPDPALALTPQGRRSYERLRTMTRDLVAS